MIRHGTRVYDVSEYMYRIHKRRERRAAVRGWYNKSEHGLGINKRTWVFNMFNKL